MAFKNYSNKKEKEIKYEVIEKFGELDSDSKYVKELRLVSWNGKDPVYDLRGWMKNDDGTESMTKGITLDAEELQSLYDILTEMNEEDDE
jgi:hypothetical protein